MARREDPKQTLDIFMDALGFEREYRFVPDRKFRADYRHGALLVEYEGGVFHAAEGHRATGKYLRDLEKYNLAALNGYKVLRVTAKHVENGDAFTWIEKALEEIS